jgi:hypothetical protein
MNTESVKHSMAIPVHLPRQLTICYYGWDWITSALPGEAYGDLDRAMRETRERGFNCIRPDLGLGLLYGSDGRRLGQVEFRARLPGANSNMQCVDAKGGGVHDVWQRVMHLFELAEEHDLYIIGTTWLYQDLLTEVADDALRTALVSVPYNERISFLAREWDRLLSDLRARGLLRRLAMVEVVNELDCTQASAAESHAGTTPTYETWRDATIPPAPLEKQRDMARAAVAFLRERHPELLITVDMGSAANLARLLPENAQVADHHVYSDGITMHIMAAAGVIPWGEHAFPYDRDPLVQDNAVLRSLLKPQIISWDEVRRRGKNTKPPWCRFAWFYQNLDQAKYDAWCVSHYPECRERILNSVESGFRIGAEFARSHGLPLVVDEGYILYPPLQSRFLMTPEGRWGEEIGIDAAIARGYWGVLPTGYFRPNTPVVWHDESQCNWIAGWNRRILNSGGNCEPTAAADALQRAAER